MVTPPSGRGDIENITTTSQMPLAVVARAACFRVVSPGRPLQYALQQAARLLFSSLMMVGLLFGMPEGLQALIEFLSH